MELRAARTEATRRRIVEAAIASYRERGIARTSMRDVAQRADVSRTTVLNHFPTTGALVTAAIRLIVATLDVPARDIFSGAREGSERARLLVDALFEYYERSRSWFETFRNEFATVPELRAGEAAFWRSIAPLYREALGAQWSDKRVRAPVLGLTSPGTFSAMREAGVSVVRAAEIIGDSVTAAARNTKKGRKR